MEFCFRISMFGDGAKMKFLIRVLMNIFISAVLNLYPKHECGPKLKVIKFPMPGCAGERT